MSDEPRAGAILSEDGLYRYRLWRELPPWMGTYERRTMVFVMLNPSTADATKDDPTIRRCIHFARREGCTRLEVVNLFAYRSPHPSDMRDAMEAGIDIGGPENLTHAGPVLHYAAIVVAAWGANIDRFPPSDLTRRLASNPIPLHCLGTTKDGHPKHPLARGRSRIADDQPLVGWPS